MLNYNRFIEMISAGFKFIDLEYEYINDLNVFPVPDGDTGSNMRTTIKGGIEAVKNANVTNFKTLGDTFSFGLLMNARGNSGVIFSQIMRGLVSNFDENMLELTPAILIESFRLAKEKGYSAVINPIEGTILTIIRLISDGISQKSYDDVESLFSDVIKFGSDALEQTPELLKELKEVGVVDSGGYGLMTFLKGMDACLKNQLDEAISLIKNTSHIQNAFQTEKFKFLESSRDEDGGYGYCSEIILELGDQINLDEISEKLPFDINKFKKNLLKFGNSLVCVQDNNIVKVHIHTFKPYLLLRLAQKYGEFVNVKIENMTRQFINHKSNNPKINNINVKNGSGLLVVVPTKKISNIFINDYGVNKTIISEESGIPSVETFVEKIYEIGLKNCFIITDDSNIVLAAQEATKLVENKIKAAVIPSKNVFEALIATINFDTSASFKSNLRYMTKSSKNSLSAVISKSVKNVSYSHINVNKDDFIGIIGKKIVASEENELVVLKQTLDKLIKNKKNLDICYLVCGKNSSSHIIKEFEKYAYEKYDLYCEVKDGGQKLYYYYLGLQ